MRTTRKMKRAVGIPRVLFEILFAVLEQPFKKRRSKGGPKPKLALEDILLMTLTYYRDYPTFFSLGNMFGIDKSNAYRWVIWTESILSTAFDGIVDIQLLDETSEQLVDVTECTIQRPKNYDMQRKYYSGKKKTYYQSSNYYE